MSLPRDQVTQLGRDARSADVTVHGDGEFDIRAFRGSPSEASVLTTASGVADSLYTGGFGLRAYPYRGMSSTILVQRALPIWAGNPASFPIRPVSSGQYRVGSTGTPALSPAASPWTSVVVRASVGVASSAATVQPGQAFALSGVVGPRASGPVVLQWKAGTLWQNVSRSTSSSLGGYRFSTRWSRVGSVQYRVVRPADAGHATGVSRTVAVEVSPIRFGRIRYDAPGTDRSTAASLNGEYVTLTNVGPAARALTGWTLQDAAGHTYRFRTGTLGGDRSVVLHTGRGADRAGLRYWGLRSHLWNNTGDRAVLRDAAGRLVDSCSWSARGTGTTSC